MAIKKSVQRRRYHAEEFKLAVIEACCEPGASVAGTAMANGVNANQVRRWMRERGIKRSLAQCELSESRPTPAVAAEFVALPIAPAMHESRDIRIEIQRGDTAIQVVWPTQAAADCAAWLRDCLR